LEFIHQDTTINNLFYSYKDKIQYIIKYPFATWDIPIKGNTKLGRADLDQFIKDADDFFYKNYPNHKRKEWPPPKFPPPPYLR
jgi:hypothetical protein